MTTIDWYAIPLDDVILELKSSRERGLSHNEALFRLDLYGPNSLPQMKRKSFLKILIKQFLGPLTLLLFIASMLAFFLGDLRDSLVILIVVLMNSLIGSFHELKAKNSIESLQNLAPQKSLVMRDGKELHLDSIEIVPGDILILSAKAVEVLSFVSNFSMGSDSPVSEDSFNNSE